MPNTTRKPRKAHKYATLTDFAAALKSPISTVSGWLRHDSWQWPKKGPWPHSLVPLVLNWAADTLESGRPSKEKTDPEGVETQKNLREQKLRQEIRKLRAHADQAETALARERGALHDAAECEDEAVRRAGLYRTSVQNIPPQLVSLALSHGMPHEAAAEFQQQIDQLVNGCLRFTATSPDAITAPGNGEST